MSSKVEVVNRALVKIGSNTITLLTDASEQARKANTVFNGLAKAELRRQAWSFAKKRAVLAPHATSVGLPTYGYSHSLPSDFLRIVWLDGQWVFSSIREAGFIDDPTYSIEGSSLLRNDSGSATISYIADLSNNVELWDETFVDAFTCRLAVELTHPITKNLQLRQTIKADYLEALKEAKRINAIELPPQGIPDGSWVLARLW